MDKLVAALVHHPLPVHVKQLQKFSMFNGQL